MNSKNKQLYVRLTKTYPNQNLAKGQQFPLRIPYM